MEQRLIDANALIKAMCSSCALFLDETCEGNRISCYPSSIVREQPTVDAVQVVANDRNKLCPINHGLRCKDIEDCAFWCEWGQCAVKAIAVACADGERKDGERDA
jgi:hypothetical protein